MTRRDQSQDRLTQIWGAFSDRTSIDLRGTGVEATPRPTVARDSTHERADAPVFASEPMRATTLPGGAADPVRAALTAMHEKIAAGSAGRAASPRSSAADQMAFGQHPQPPVSSLERTLFADLAFTESKVSRRGGDYISFAAARQADWQKRKRKKFLGIF